jgi:hypothetical protein
MAMLRILPTVGDIYYSPDSVDATMILNSVQKQQVIDTFQIGMDPETDMAVDVGGKPSLAAQHPVINH